MTTRKGLFDEPSVDREAYRLILAAYFNKTDTALELIDKEPEQINNRDPYSGLTALHLAIFRQNEDIVRALIEHPDSDISIKDNFNRRAYEMLIYNSNQEVFQMVLHATYPEYKDWDAIFAEEDRNAEEEAWAMNEEFPKVTPIKPKLE